MEENRCFLKKHKHIHYACEIIAILKACADDLLSSDAFTQSIGLRDVFVVFFFLFISFAL